MILHGFVPRNPKDNFLLLILFIKKMKNIPKPKTYIKHLLCKGPLKLSLSSQGGCIPIIPLLGLTISHGLAPAVEACCPLFVALSRILAEH